jgi:putative acetyltransferase
MISITRTNSSDKDFAALVALLDADLAIRDGDDHAFYAQFNKTHTLQYALVARWGDEAVGSGAIRHHQEGIMEVKRMYVLPDFRGRGIAMRILQELENWTAELGYHRCILETGKQQPEAIALYQKAGYTLIDNYGQYAGVYNSVCMQKEVG